MDFRRSAHIGVYGLSECARRPASRAGVKAGREFRRPDIGGGRWKEVDEDKRLRVPGRAPTSNSGGGGGNDAAEKAKNAELPKNEDRWPPTRRSNANQVIGDLSKPVTALTANHRIRRSHSQYDIGLAADQGTRRSFM